MYYIVKEDVVMLIEEIDDLLYGVVYNETDQDESYVVRNELGDTICKVENTHDDFKYAKLFANTKKVLLFLKEEILECEDGISNCSTDWCSSCKSCKLCQQNIARKSRIIKVLNKIGIKYKVK